MLNFKKKKKGPGEVVSGKMRPASLPCKASQGNQFKTESYECKGIIGQVWGIASYAYDRLQALSSTEFSQAIRTADL